MEHRASRCQASSHAQLELAVAAKQHSRKLVLDSLLVEQEQYWCRLAASHWALSVKGELDVSSDWDVSQWYWSELMLCWLMQARARRPSRSRWTRCATSSSGCRGARTRRCWRRRSSWASSWTRTARRSRRSSSSTCRRASRRSSWWASRWRSTRRTSATSSPSTSATCSPRSPGTCCCSLLALLRAWLQFDSPSPPHLIVTHELGARVELCHIPSTKASIPASSSVTFSFVLPVLSYEFTSAQVPRVLWLSRPTLVARRCERSFQESLASDFRLLLHPETGALFSCASSEYFTELCTLRAAFGYCLYAAFLCFQIMIYAEYATYFDVLPTRRRPAADLNLQIHEHVMYSHLLYMYFRRP